ncbi:MAG: response regulator [Candidatus Moraniibacteriota bacterium]
MIEQMQNKKILMIEDEDVFIDIFGGKLQQDGFEMTFAKNGAWGLKEMESGDYDLVIVDMAMPAMGGEEIVTKMKLEEKTRNLPVVVLSASVDEETRRKIESLGISGFFLKTRITPGELSQEITKILG